MYSVEEYIPSNEIIPDIAQTIKQRPTDCVSCRTPLGETNIPEPNYNDK